MHKIVMMLAVAASLLVTGTAWPQGASTTVMISARVERFAEWGQDATVLLEVPGAINKMKQERTASRAIVLHTNTDAIVSVKPGLHDGVLTNGSATLKTAYRLTGAVVRPDAAFKEAGEFLSPQNTYHVMHVRGVGSYPMMLEVRGSGGESAAPEEGVYVCGVVMTASW